MAPMRAFATRLASAAASTTTKSSRSPLITTTACLRSNSSSSSRRAYHSYDHPPPPGAFNSAERQILSAAYRHVPEHGFTHKALSLGARDAGYLDISTNVVPEGPFSLIKYHLVSKREALAPRSAEIFNAPVAAAADRATPDTAAGARGQLLTVPERVERLTWERLLANQDVIHRWQEALAVMAQPSRVPASLHELALLSDEIHHLAGDLAVDPSWYTKRASLSTIYASSELFMTNDRSAGFGDTRAFLRRRLDETGSLAGALGSIGQWVGFTASAGLNVLRSKGARI
ncbi:ubiquinone biosynthesis protein COQ9 [Apiospora hydei]|uniref:Ubiquinone biosynthesis protein n=1 Tax=Apiospora hydei TaxID=1337664 RepID=A0ABR1WM13_9PEZI